MEQYTGLGDTRTVKNRETQRDRGNLQTKTDIVSHKKGQRRRDKREREREKETYSASERKHIAAHKKIVRFRDGFEVWEIFMGNFDWNERFMKLIRD